MPFSVKDGDFGFCGPAYTPADPYQDRQICVNYYVEIDKTPGARVPMVLLGTPGLVQVASALGMTTAGQVSYVPAPTAAVPLPAPIVT